MGTGNKSWYVAHQTPEIVYATHSLAREAVKSRQLTQAERDSVRIRARALSNALHTVAAKELSTSTPVPVAEVAHTRMPWDTLKNLVVSPSIPTSPQQDMTLPLARLQFDKYDALESNHKMNNMTNNTHHHAHASEHDSFQRKSLHSNSWSSEKVDEGEGQGLGGRGKCVERDGETKEEDGFTSDDSQHAHVLTSSEISGVVSTSEVCVCVCVC